MSLTSCWGSIEQVPLRVSPLDRSTPAEESQNDQTTISCSAKMCTILKPHRTKGFASWNGRRHHTRPLLTSPMYSSSVGKDGHSSILKNDVPCPADAKFDSRNRARIFEKCNSWPQTGDNRPLQRNGEIPSNHRSVAKIFITYSQGG